jgi:hypothetical protein
MIARRGRNDNRHESAWERLGVLHRGGTLLIGVAELDGGA